MFTNLATQTVFAANGVCHSGFRTCSQSLGGGCCPGNFACESGPSCTAVTGAGEVAKVAPGGAADVGVEVWGWFTVAVGLVMGVAMVVL